MIDFNLFNPLNLSNGLILSVLDHTKAYFGDYHLVKLEMILSLGNAGDIKLSGVDHIALCNIKYKRCLERMGVHSSDIESVKDSLFKDFEVNSLPYMSSQGFLQRLLERELTSQKSHLKRFVSTGL